MKPTLNILLLIITAFLASCAETDKIVNEPDNEVSTYFPLEENREWKYESIQIATSDDSTAVGYDTLKFKICCDTIFEGVSYKKLLNAEGNTYRIIRVEGSAYYARDHYSNPTSIIEEVIPGYSNEYKFLDTSLAAGGSWSYDENEQSPYKIEYTIKAKNVERSILGKVYKNVIEVEVNYSYKELGEYKPWVKVIHYYAKGVGELYNYYPYPLSGLYANSKSYLISNM